LGYKYPNTGLKKQAAEQWCRQVTECKKLGRWEYQLVEEDPFRKALDMGIETLNGLVRWLRGEGPAGPLEVI
jgi:hypothetical protein